MFIPLLAKGFINTISTKHSELSCVYVCVFLQLAHEYFTLLAEALQILST